MSNRRKSAQQRRAQSYRNAGRSEPVVHADGKGNVRRGQGRNNFAYGPITTSTGVATLHKRAARPRKSYDGQRVSVMVMDEIDDFDAALGTYATLTRDQLRVAAKNLGVEGWHKMNKAQLLAAVTA